MLDDFWSLLGSVFDVFGLVAVLALLFPSNISKARIYYKKQMENQDFASPQLMFFPYSLQFLSIFWATVVKISNLEHKN